MDVRLAEFIQIGNVSDFDYTQEQVEDMLSTGTNGIYYYQQAFDLFEQFGDQDIKRFLVFGVENDNLRRFCTELSFYTRIPTYMYRDAETLAEKILDNHGIPLPSQSSFTDLDAERAGKKTLAKDFVEIYKNVAECDPTTAIVFAYPNKAIEYRDGFGYRSVTSYELETMLDMINKGETMPFYIVAGVDPS